jgi:hypothetical protein
LTASSEFPRISTDSRFVNTFSQPLKDRKIVRDTGCDKSCLNIEYDQNNGFFHTPIRGGASSSTSLTQRTGKGPFPSEMSSQIRIILSPFTTN